MRHDESWYAGLAGRLGHPGFLSLAEIRQAEARDARQTAATAKWRRSPVGLYWTAQYGARFTVIREPGRRTWKIEVWPLDQSEPRYGRTQAGVGSLRDAKALALAMPCARCGMAAPLIEMTRRMPARPSLKDVISERWRCADSTACEAERIRLTGGEAPLIPVRDLISPPQPRMQTDYTAQASLYMRGAVPVPVELTVHNPETGQSASYVIDPAGSPPCKNDLLRYLEDRDGR